MGQDGFLGVLSRRRREDKTAVGEVANAHVDAYDGLTFVLFFFSFSTFFKLPAAAHREIFIEDTFQFRKLKDWTRVRDRVVAARASYIGSSNFGLFITTQSGLGKLIEQSSCENGFCAAAIDAGDIGDSFELGKLAVVKPLKSGGHPWLIWHNWSY